MKNICLVNGSLRGKKAASLEFLKDIDLKLADMGYSKTIITVKVKVKDRYPEEILNSLTVADVIIFIFPLHNYGLPGALMKLLEDYYQYKKSYDNHKDAAVYMIVNCAFPRAGETCGEAGRVIRNFCRRLDLNWRFAICIGTGPVVVMTKKVPFLYPKLKKAYTEIISDIRSPGKDRKSDYLIKPVIPESIIAAIKRHYEKKGRMIEPDKKPRQA
ncbi:MAG TPA: NAD(P)H-dependent oxidoreductase [Dehalococcoidales bacterium]|nr:NAD(P)H-dependent oxidoreductase [Dehalococcoidales bacterium]